MTNAIAFDVTSSSIFTMMDTFSTIPRQAHNSNVDVWIIAGTPQKIQNISEEELDYYDVLSADIVYQRILDGKEKVYSSEEARKILGLDD